MSCPAFPDPVLLADLLLAVDLVGAITPAWLIQTFSNLFDQSPLPPIHTAQEFSQF